MVVHKNATVRIFAETTEMNSEGDCIQSFSEVESIVGDVQPHALTEAELKAYGISTRKANVKLFLYDGLHDSIKAGNRAKVVSALTKKTDTYEIMPANVWTRHGECLLVPVENEDDEEGDDEETEEDEQSEGLEGTD